ncbi:M48 family metallopeptidase, partial [Chloroflexota bacterium]
ALGGIYALLWLVTSWSIDLRDYLLGLTNNDWLLVAGFILVFGGIYFLIDLPLGYYSSYVMPHRYGLSTQTFKGWINDQVKGVLVGGVLGLLVIEIIYYVLRISPNLWWLWAGLILLFFNVILANLAPVLLMPLFYKFVPLEEEHADLVARLLNLADRAGTRVRGVYKFDMSRRTKAANAAITGLGNTRRIILGDTLIEEFTPDEIETVLAHELGHQVHRDIPIGILVESVITLGGLYLASLGLEWGVATLGYAGLSDIAAMPLFVLVMGAYGLLVMPLGNAFLRWREIRADEYALKMTGKGEAYASALTRLANQNLAEADPEPWVVTLLYSHPALGKRIAMAENYN